LSLRKRQLSLLLSFLPEKKEEELVIKNQSDIRKCLPAINIDPIISLLRG
jgi:hypothetical protein